MTWFLPCSDTSDGELSQIQLSMAVGEAAASLVTTVTFATRELKVELVVSSRTRILELANASRVLIGKAGSAKGKIAGSVPGPWSLTVASNK